MKKYSAALAAALTAALGVAAAALPAAAAGRHRHRGAVVRRRTRRIAGDAAGGLDHLGRRQPVREQLPGLPGQSVGGRGAYRGLRRLGPQRHHVRPGQRRPLRLADRPDSGHRGLRAGPLPAERGHPGDRHERSERQLPDSDRSRPAPRARRPDHPRRPRPDRPRRHRDRLDERHRGGQPARVQRQAPRNRPGRAEQPASMCAWWT